MEQKLLTNFSDRNYTNCWCKVLYKGDEYVWRLVGYRKGIFSFFGFYIDEYNVPMFKLLKSNEFKIFWVGKGEYEDKYIFGKDLEDTLADIFEQDNLSSDYLSPDNLSSD
jgi:hypothetical protein